MVSSERKPAKARKRSAKVVVVARKPSESNLLQGQWLKMSAASLDSVQANILVANLDLEIVYMNLCAKETLGKLAEEIHRIFGVEPEGMVGASIHRFSKDPQRIERLLSAPRALPHQAEFTFGSTTLQARINSIPDSAGKTQGYVVAWEDVTERQRRELDYVGQIAAIQSSQAVVEFELNGTIISANDIFLKAVGYSLQEIKGQRHSMFVEEALRSSSEYQELWQRLNRGECVAGEFRRVGKGGREIYLQGVYSPIVDKAGKPFKVVKYAADVTETRLRNADNEGQIAAISRVQAVIEFGLDGVIATANDNFLQAMGYRLDEIQGRHHSMFVDPGHAASTEYRQFWLDLA